MSHPMGAPLRDRMDVEFVEADVEIGFKLVDMAGSELDRGNLWLVSRVLADAEEVYRDIESRLERAGERQRDSFQPLVEELRRELDSTMVRYHQG